MSGQSVDYDVPCPVPECVNGYVRIPVIIERTHYGCTEKFVEFDSFQCAECGGMGYARTYVTPPADGREAQS